jgi:hypothetical protein
MLLPVAQYQINLKLCIPWASQSDYDYLASCQREYLKWLIQTAHGLGVSFMSIPGRLDMLQYLFNKTPQLQQTIRY